MFLEGFGGKNASRYIHDSVYSFVVVVHNLFSCTIAGYILEFLIGRLA